MCFDCFVFVCVVYCGFLIWLLLMFISVVYVWLVRLFGFLWDFGVWLLLMRVLLWLFE